MGMLGLCCLVTMLSSAMIPGQILFGQGIERDSHLLHLRTFRIFKLQSTEENIS